MPARHWVARQTAGFSSRIEAFAVVGAVQRCWQLHLLGNPVTKDLVLCATVEPSS